MAKTIEQKIVKKVGKKMNKNEKSQIMNEMNLINSLSYDELKTQNYRPHFISEGKNEKYLAVDADAINDNLNQTGRGDYRYLKSEGNLYGLAIHREKGKGYRIIVRDY